MALTDAAPTREIGHSGTYIPGWDAWADPAEDIPHLRYPHNLPIWHRMRTDSQVHALLQAVFLPVRRKRWVVVPNGAPDVVVEQVASDLNLPIQGVPRSPSRARRRFNHDEHLRLALLAMAYGHMFFEQYGDIVESDDENENLRWRLRRLGVRLPQSISKINVASDGGLESIVQHSGRVRPEPIPVTQLVAYVWDKEGANWAGRSALRPLYRHYLIKDRLIRIDAMKNEKYGVGIPTGKAPQGVRDVAVYGEMARGIKAGDDAGVGLPYGADLGVEGIRGSLPDTIESIRYHDEAMARDFLAMVLQLGQTKTGSRALGNTFVDFFDMSIDAVCGWYSTTTTEHVIEDMVDWNWGEDVQAPALAWEEPDEGPLAIDDLARLVESELLVVDDEVREYVSHRFGLPALPPPGQEVAEGEPDGGSSSVAASVRRHRRAAAATQTVDRPTVGHRELMDHEVRAAFDPEVMQEAWQAATTALVDQWGAIRAQQIDALVDAVEAAVAVGSADALAALSAPVLGTDLIVAAMLAAAEDAVTAARAEAAAQGVAIELIDTAELEPTILRRANAVAVLMARSLSESAARQALNRYGADVLDPAQVAAGVRDHLEELSDAYLNDQLGGALTQAQNTGRRAVMARRPCRVYASEILDLNTCARCLAIDGREYPTLSDAEADYPTGGHAECLGGPRCRGTLVAVYEEAAPSTEAA